MNVIDLLIKQNINCEKEGRFQDMISKKEIIANIYIFMFAGMDTTKSLTINSIFHLSREQHYQVGLREDIRNNVFSKNLKLNLKITEATISLNTLSST